MKKLLCLVLALMLVLCCFAGCGDKADDDVKDDGTNNENNNENNNEDNEENNEGSGAITINLGGIGPLTGDTAVYGIAVQQGAQIAVDEIKEMGGEYVFEYNFQDDEGDAEKAVNAYNVLKDWNMQLLMGTVTTTPCIAVAAETYADRIFEITPSASSPEVTADKDNVFQLCFTDPNQGTGAATYISDHNLGTKIGVIYDNSGAYSTGIYEKFAEKAEELNLDIVYTGTFTEDSASDFSVQLKDAQTAGADLLFLPIYYTPASLILTQAEAMGYAPKFFGCDGFDGLLTIEGFDTSLAEGVMMLTPFAADAEDELTQNFVTKYQDAYGEVPNQFAADAYDCVYALYNACVEAGITAEMTTEEICDALIAVFTSDSFSYDGLTGTDMTWDTNGEVAKAPLAIVIEDGTYVSMG